MVESRRNQIKYHLFLSKRKTTQKIIIIIKKDEINRNIYTNIFISLSYIDISINKARKKKINI